MSLSTGEWNNILRVTEGLLRLLDDENCLPTDMYFPPDTQIKINDLAQRWDFKLNTMNTVELTSDAFDYIIADLSVLHDIAGKTTVSIPQSEASSLKSDLIKIHEALQDDNRFDAFLGLLTGIAKVLSDKGVI